VSEHTARRWVGRFVAVAIVAVMSTITASPAFAM
jgi:hypothetical protein